MSGKATLAVHNMFWPPCWPNAWGPRTWLLFSRLSAIKQKKSKEEKSKRNRKRKIRPRNKNRFSKVKAKNSFSTRETPQNQNLNTPETNHQVKMLKTLTKTWSKERKVKISPKMTQANKESRKSGKWPKNASERHSGRQHHERTRNPYAYHGTWFQSRFHIQVVQQLL